MELRQLRYFVAIAEELSFTRAARRLNMTQPPLSLQIRNLEEDLQTRLFDRTRRSVKLTPAGEILFEQAVAILRRADQAKDLCRRAGGAAVGRLAIGFIPIALDLVILRIMRSLRRTAPAVRLSLFELGTNAQLDALRRGAIDIGFIQVWRHDLRGLESQCIVSERYQLAVPRAHALAARQRIPVAALAGVNLILSPRQVQPHLRDAIVDSCRRAGFEPQTDFEVYGKHTALALTAAGLGVTPISDSYLKKRVAGVVFRPLDADWPAMEIHMVWLSDAQNPVLDRVRDLVATKRD